MEKINAAVGVPLGYMMRFCWRLTKDYGIAVMVFTLFTKVILFPLSLWVQKNSIKMVKMKPQLDELKYQYTDDKDAYFDAQSALYKKEKYSPMAGVLPLLLQLPIIFGLIDVVYKPLKHLLHFGSDTIAQLTAITAKLPEFAGKELGSTAQLKVVEAVTNPTNAGAFSGIDAETLGGIEGLDMSFLGINLSETPSLPQLNALLLVPLLAGLTALVMCVVQNRINVLQIEQSPLSKWGMAAFMVAFSTYFAFIVPTGVGLYWAWSNVFSIGVMYLVNLVYKPKKYIDYESLERTKAALKEQRQTKKRNKALAKKYCKEFFRPDNFKNIRLMFYSEGSGYYKYFANIIEALLKNSEYTIHYVTSDPDDAVFSLGNPRIKPYYADETRLITLMMRVEADIVVMTTPDLEKYHIKRSKVRKDVEYIYVDHACSSLNLSYRTGALDHFDTIFAVGPAQAAEVRALERLRKTPKKRIIKCGYGLIDNMEAAYKASGKSGEASGKSGEASGEKPVILIAPSWQYDNILDSCLDELLSALCGRGWKIVIRPHPQYIKRFPVKMRKILEKYAAMLCDDFVIQTDFSSNATVYNADLLITDWSAISFEYSFTTGRPTLFVNTQMKVVNKDYRLIDIEPFDISARKIIGTEIEKSEAAAAEKTAQYLISHGEEYRERIEKLKAAHFYNLGSSGEVGARYIISCLSRKVPPRGASPDSAARAHDTPNNAPDTAKTDG